jgi:hypothetical protein
MDFTIQTNVIDAKHFYNGVVKNQLPFAMSRSVNRLAWDIKQIEQSKLDKYFDMRTNWLRKSGAMPVIASNKKQPQIHSILGVKDLVAAMNAIGGNKVAKSGDMAVPFSNSGNGKSAREILNPGRETLPMGKWPSNIVKANKKIRRRNTGQKPKPFYMVSKGKRYVALRTSTAIQFIYSFQKSVSINKQWPLVNNAENFVRNNYDDYLEYELNRAIASMRTRF